MKCVRSRIRRPIIHLPAEEGGSDLDFCLVNSETRDREPWPSCPRHILRVALADLHRETGTRLVTACEHEFTYSHPDIAPASSFTLESIRRFGSFADALADASEAADLGFDTIEPEFGVGQIEVCTEPRIGLASVDNIVFAREVIREVARRQGGRASFLPKPHPDAVGNGAHLHFSFLDDDDKPAGFDPDAAHEMSELTRHFVAGVFQHLPALVGFCAPSPVSYLRLGPHHWSCGYAAFGVQNRECALRICPSPVLDKSKRGKAFNIEFRPMDGTCNPFIAVAAIVHAGLDGVRRKLDPPPLVDTDPADLTDDERTRLGVYPLPATLQEAIAAIEADTDLAANLPAEFLDVFLSLKRFEATLGDTLTPDDLCEKYAYAY
ncbi:MAG: glutamine synthetase family protein [Pseudomonadota bacterium]